VWIIGQVGTYSNNNEEIWFLNWAWTIQC